MTREEAIKWLKAIKDKYIRGGDEEFDRQRKVAVDMAIKALEQPESDDWSKYSDKLWKTAYERGKRDAEQPERKKGKWIELYHNNYKCSVCGDWWVNNDNEMVKDFKFCPNCGTDMRGEENGTGSI